MPAAGKRGYRIALGVSLLFVMSRSFYPDFFDNEWIYSLNPIKLMHPGLFANDFFLADFYPFFLFWDALTAPLYYVFGDLAAVLILRLAIWSFQLWALSRLARTLGIVWWGFIALVVVWLNVEQTLAAGAWIILSANSKPVAYGFLFLALNSLLRCKARNAGIFAGLSGTFHVIVGFWACSALLATLAVLHLRDREKWRDIWRFGLFAFLFALPGIVPPLLGELKGMVDPAYAGVAGEVAKINVVFANPFHMDPLHFMTGLEPLKVAVFFVVTPLLVLKFLPAEYGKKLAIFLVILCVFFVSGIVGRYAEWFGYLKYFPFRLADSLIPLTFWIALVLAYQQLVARYRRQTAALVALVLCIPLTIGFARYILNLCEPVESRTPESFVSTMSRTEPRLTAYHVRERGREWARFLRGEETDLESMLSWVNENTPEESVFIRMPWESQFSIKAQRSDFVSIKPFPGPKILEFMERIETVNRGKFETAGHEMFAELRQNYPKLTPEEVAGIKCRWGADFFLTNAVQEHPFPVTHRAGAYTLYEIQDVACDGASTSGS